MLFQFSWLNGDANCLNDGDVSDDACRSHSANKNVNNFDYCVLSAPTNISKIKVFPLQGGGYFNERMTDLQLEVFASVTGQENEASFSGLLDSEQITAFARWKTDPAEFSITIPASIPCPNSVSPSLKSLSYKTLYGKAYVLIPPSTSSGSIPANTKSKIEVSCSLTQCLQNEFLSNGACTSCPSNTRAPIGSTDSSSCTNCPAGTFLPHPLSTDCAVSNNHISIFASKGWRIWADPSNLSHSSNWWRIKELEFYESEDCSGNKVDTSVGTAVASGCYSGSWDADNAFGGWDWLGFLDSDGFNWVGMNFDTEILVQCIKVFTADDSKADALRVQAYDESNAEWVNVWIENNLDQTPSVHTIPLVGSSPPSQIPSNSMIPSDQPSLQPSISPSVSNKPSHRPSLSHSDSPSSLPSLSPSSLPSNEPSMLPSLLEPSSNPSSLPSTQPSKTNKPSSVPSSIHSDIPSFIPSDQPSLSPSTKPSTKPSFTPTTINQGSTCKDSGAKFKKKINTDGEYKKRSCAWLLRKPEKTRSRCESGNKQKIKTHCPNACGACEQYKCLDSEKKWFLWGDEEKMRNCKWVGEDPSKIARRCGKNGVAATCRATCKYTNTTLGLSC